MVKQSNNQQKHQRTIGGNNQHAEPIDVINKHWNILEYKQQDKYICKRLPQVRQTLVDKYHNKSQRYERHRSKTPNPHFESLHFRSGIDDRATLGLP